MKQNISELAETIYRIKQQPDVIIDRHFARVLKKAVIKDHKFYVPIHRESIKTIKPIVGERDERNFLIVFTDLAFVRISENLDAVPMTMFQKSYKYGNAVQNLFMAYRLTHFIKNIV